jgi:hypothetical protein
LPATHGYNFATPREAVNCVGTDETRATWDLGSQ